MKYALMVVVIIAGLVWADLNSPLTGLAPAVRDTDRAIERLVEELAAGAEDAARREAAVIRRGWRRIHVWLSLLSDKESRHRFERLLGRIDAGLAAGETGGLTADAAELREVWHEILSP